ncbi:restriction endonuclease subunit S [Afifella marina]|uniref:Type I restriction enzyme, S subunit n=1 Tax=Afifella marina DSM 2698 TaxID=1120955 RepID=A0A1G5NJM2_AFIMA|nr:restriction endonuclease subunit S [Afifella marina]MBK1623499.1 restriction endonuclease subunit S [Afifella marina DSM 2698]MBK1626492.1 restriction endonuclease subunit S [Afifella marina]MBK5916041.1 hypothetical protein [Afifella marina]RAI18354.1 hypothetical protein CH311_15565 [Afifella marina DSM 2698]SCZ36800.1 type I restriction enzyme, S subunit [Afifella marina DSM 2698]
MNARFVDEVPIGEVVELVRKWNPSRVPDDRFAYIDLSSVDQEAKEITGAVNHLGASAPSRARQLIAAGDILVSTVRPNLNAVALVPDKHDGSTASTGFCVLRPARTKIDANYLFHWVRSPRFVDCMVRQATGASYPAVTDRIVKASEIPLPPLDEQRRIAAILDKADALRRKRRQALELLDGLTQSIFLEMFGERLAGSQVALGEVIERIDSGWSPKCLGRPARAPEAGILKLSSVTSGSFRPEENKALPGDLSARPQDQVGREEVLLCRKNTKELVGASAFVWEKPQGLYISDLIFRLVPKEDVVNAVYLQSALSIPSVRAEMSALAGGAAGSMPNISKRKLREISVPLPPVDLQKQFAALAAKVHAHRSSAASSERSLAALFRSLQARAFSGAL